MTTTFDVLNQRVHEGINDWIEVIVTTAINADNLVVSLNLNEFDGGSDTTFNDWYCYITDKANVGVDRQVSAYATATGQLTVRGVALTDDAANLATIRLHRYSYTLVGKAINRAIEEVFPALHKKADDLSLITGNILPDASFEWWTSSSAMQFYSVTNTTLAQTTTAGLYRGQRGSTSVKSTVSGAGGYHYISSDSYPRLLDLMGQTVNAYVWAAPETADDPTIVIYTVQADGTTQTLTSTTAAPAGEFTRLALEGQAINDDLVEFQIRFPVATNGDYCYWDDAILCGQNLYEYLLPVKFQDGYTNQVYFQLEGYSDEPAYDLQPRKWGAEEFHIIDDGTYKYLGLDELPVSYRRLRLIGISPLEALSAATDTITLDASGRINLLVAYASYLLYEMTENPVSSEDVKRYGRESAKRYGKYMRLLRKFRMISPSGRLKL